MLNVDTVDHRCWSDDEWAEFALRQILEIAQTAPEPIRSQALAFQDEVHRVLRHFAGAIASERKSRDIWLIGQTAFPELSDTIRRDR